MPIEFKMPKLGESVTEGTVGRWLKQAGDSVELYEPLLEVTTDKVDTEVPSPVSGTLVQILVPEGDTVPVGTSIAVLAATNEEPLTEAFNAVPAAASSQQAAPVAPAGDGEQAVVGFVSPVVARLVADHKLDLTQIRGSGRDGRVTKQDVQRFVAERAQAPQQAQPAKPAPMPMPTPSSTPASMPVVGPSGRPAPMPVVGPSNLAASMPAATTPAAWTSSASHSAPPALNHGDQVVPLNAMRRSIAEHMVRSKRTAPHVTTVMEADMSAASAYRSAHKAEFERQGTNLTFTPFFVQAVVAGLREVAIVNASFTDEGILMHAAINVGVAVAIPDGLIVPVIRDADEKSLLGLARTVNDLAERARTRRLVSDEISGGTFTITNHGVSGSLFAMPIINQPQAAILGVGAIQKRPVVISQNGIDAIAIRPMCYLSLTFDHRLIDGATADQFLSVVKRELEGWSL